MLHLAKRSARSLAAVLVFITTSTFAWAGGPSSSAQPPKAVQQTGVLNINGCIVQAKDIILTARPMNNANVANTNIDDVSVPDSWDIAPNSTNGRIRQAHITATKDPHVFNFTFHALKVTKLYTMSARLGTTGCGQITWIGPKHGVIQPGAASSIQLNGYSLTTQIDVESTDATGNTFFRGSDALTDDSMVRRFRWHTNLAGVTDVELQIAADRFASNLENPSTCGSPSSLLMRAVLHGTTNQNFSGKVDFYQVLIGGNEGPGAGDLEFTEQISDATKLAFANGAPLYVRAIPLRADGTRMCNLLNDGVSAYSIILLAKHFAALKGEPSVLFSGDYHAAIAPTSFDFCATAVKPHLAATSLYVNTFQVTDDWLGFYFYAAGLADANHVVQPGMTYCWNHASSGFLDDVGNFISGFVDAIAQIVNYVADLYNSIKAKIVQFIAIAISQLPGIDCKEGCQAIINAALSTALTAMGLPPSLPNFDELVNDGIDYLKEEAAEQTGVPKEVVDVVVDKVVEAAKNQGGGGGGGLPDWVVDDNGFRPSRLVLDVNPNLAKLNAQPYGLGVLTIPSNLYPYASTPLPHAAMSGIDPVTGGSVPPRGFRIPIQLPPNLGGTSNPPCPLNLPGPDCGGLYSPSYMLKFKLSDWYQSRFKPLTCSQFDFLGDHNSVPLEDLGNRVVVPLYDTSLGMTEYVCQ